jgi:hypothetical protein
MSDRIILSNAGLLGRSGESYFDYSTRAAQEHERRGDVGMAQKWRTARWAQLDGAKVE